MDIEELTKSQIFLLTLLTSFVTSMATGIVTVALMDQGPLTITQSVSRVIQSTIQQAPQPDKKSQPVAAAVAVPLKPPTPSSQEPALSEVVRSVLPSIGKLSSTGSTHDFLGFGIVLDAQGTIVADYNAFGPERRYAYLALQDGTQLKMVVFANDAKDGLIFLTTDEATTTQFTPLALAKDSAAIGDTVVGIFGKTAPRISSGLIVAISNSDPTQVPIITTDLNASLIDSGAPVIARNGALVGISTIASRAIDGSSFTPTSIIAAEYVLAMQTKSNADSEALKQSKK
jgi:S1-C subfamily serine protease